MHIYIYLKPQASPQVDWRRSKYWDSTAVPGWEPQWRVCAPRGGAGFGCAATRRWSWVPCMSPPISLASQQRLRACGALYDARDALAPKSSAWWIPRALNLTNSGCHYFYQMDTKMSGNESWELGVPAFRPWCFGAALYTRNSLTLGISISTST